MTSTVRGLVIAAGGLAWLAGVAVLELTFSESEESLPTVFAVLALFAGVSVGWGLWSVAGQMDRMAARIGARLVGASSTVFGLGFGLELLPGDTFVAFLLAYSVGLFILPAAFVVMGAGVIRSVVFPGWAKWVPLSVAGVGAITYGFHAFAREVWDPSDAVWFICVGVGWFLLGLASMTIPIRTPEATPLVLGGS